MNILFYSYFKPIPTTGGIERVTDIIGSGLSKLSYHCYVIYEKDIEGECSDCFMLCNLIPEEDTEKVTYLQAYIQDNNIDVVVVQGRRDVLSLLKKAIKGTDCKLVYTLHSDPGYGYDTFNLSTLKHEIVNSTGMLRLHKIFIMFLFPLYKFRVKQRLSFSYNEAYKLVDRFVLLSEAAVPYFLKLSNINDSSKISVISNPTTYDECLPVAEFEKKENIVLIVSRMEEHTKKLSMALKAWKSIENEPSMQEWSLDIVGDGVDIDAYKKWVKTKNVKRVRFWGYQDPDVFYRKSSIFLMTSVSEAWGMSIVEAQQQMCVPIAFDSYCAVRDIIKNNENGILVKYPSLKQFARSILYLAKEIQIRKSLALSGTYSTKSFSKNNVIRQWSNLFHSL